MTSPKSVCVGGYTRACSGALSLEFLFQKRLSLRGFLLRLLVFTGKSYVIFLFFCEFEEFVFFGLWIPDSGFRISALIHTGFRFLRFRVAPKNAGY